MGREQLHQLSKWAKIAFWFALEVARLEQTEAHMRGSRQRGFAPALGAGWSEGARNLPPRCPSSRRCRLRQMPLPSRHRWPPASSSTLFTTAPTFSTGALEQKERDAFFRGETIPHSGSLSRGTCRDETFQPVGNPALYHRNRWITCDSLNNLLLRLLHNPSCPPLDRSQILIAPRFFELRFDHQNISKFPGQTKSKIWLGGRFSRQFQAGF